MGRLQLTAVLTLVTAIVVGTLLTACAPRPYGPESSLDLGVPGDVVDTVTDVQFYPACGNEPVTVDGVTWYPFVPANLAEFPEVAALATPAGEGGMGGGTMRAALPAVAAPGPGDDSGTLTVYEGGLAFWVSDSGALETWLTDQELEYSWVC
jgi:hypothetical protein